jgi:hypothetical protein
MSRCYYCATTKTTCPACTRRALEQAVIDAARAVRDLPGTHDGPDHAALVRMYDALWALDGGVSHE